jgi:4-amino-4-deoxy-L-arabinose transferase-like glycosyltransferase
VTPDRRTILALFALAFGLRILYAVVGINTGIIANPYTHDFLVASKIAAGAQWWSQPVSPYAPGYQFLLAFLFRVGGAHYWLVVVLQAAMAGVTAFFLFRIGERRFCPNAGLFAAIWLAIYVHHMHYSSIAIRDVTTAMLFVYVCYLMVLYAHSMRGAVWTGIVLAVLIHFDPQFLFLFPVIALYFLLYATRHKLLNLQSFFLFLGCVLVLMLPWTIRNQRVYGDAIPVGLETARYARPVKHVVDSVLNPPEPERRLLPPRADFARNTAEFWRVTRFRQETPPDAGNRPPEPAWSLRHNLVSIASYGVLLPFFIAGIWLSVKRKNRAGLVIAALVLAFFLIRLGYGGSERTRLQVEPLIILLAFYTIADFFARFRNRRAPDTAEG